MKKMIKTIGFVALLAGITGNMQLNAFFENEARQVADFCFKEVQKGGFYYPDNAEEVRALITVGKVITIAGGSVSALIALFCILKAIKRTVTHNNSENKLLGKCKTLLSFLGSSMFTLTTLGAAFLYKVATYNENDFKNLGSYSATMTRLLAQGNWLK